MFSHNSCVVRLCTSWEAAPLAVPDAWLKFTRTVPFVFKPTIGNRSSADIVKFNQRKITILDARRANPLCCRNRLNQNKPNKRPFQTPHILDVWLPRLSNLAQVVLLVLTTGSLYFTVLTLYQKALLDEAIAKKEIELRTISAALESKYVQIRYLVIRDYILLTVPGCKDIIRKILESADEPVPLDATLTLDIKHCIVSAEPTIRSLDELREEIVFSFVNNSCSSVTDSQDYRSARGRPSRTQIVRLTRAMLNSWLQKVSLKRVYCEYSKEVT